MITSIMATNVWPVLKVVAFVIIALFLWALKSTWSEKDDCRDCTRCTESVLDRMWKTPLLGPLRAVERIWLRKCPRCRHRLEADHGYRDDGMFLD